MENRIKIGDQWYVKEQRSSEDPTMFRGCSLGIYTCNILQEGLEKIMLGTCWVELSFGEYEVGAQHEIMDNIEFLQDFRDSKHDKSLMEDTSYSNQDDLRQLLTYVTDLGWLQKPSNN